MLINLHKKIQILSVKNSGIQSAQFALNGLDF